MIRGLLVRLFSRTRLQARFWYHTVPDNPAVMQSVRWYCRLLPRLVAVPDAAYGFQFYLDIQVPLTVNGQVKIFNNLTVLPGRFFPNGCLEGGQVVDCFGGKHAAADGDRML